jgi:hypothetical protein
MSNEERCPIITAARERASELRTRDQSMSDAPWGYHKHGSMGPDTYVLEGSSLSVPYGDAPDVRGIASSRNDLGSTADLLDNLSEQLERARNAIAVLYVGNTARRPDGSADVDAIINTILGES